MAPDQVWQQAWSLYEEERGVFHSFVVAAGRRLGISVHGAHEAQSVVAQAILDLHLQASRHIGAPDRYCAIRGPIVPGLLLRQITFALQRERASCGRSLLLDDESLERCVPP